jgi:D-proline reductase (dithiol) PrdB
LFLKAYPWRRIDPVSWAPLKKPLKESRAALVSSAGLVQPGQKPFDDTIRGGDYNFREIPADMEVAALIDTHRSDLYDHTGLRQDPNLVFPLDRLRERVGSGRIGSLNQRHLSFMGSITAPGRLVKKTAPVAVRKLVEDGVDIALLVPV